MRVPPQLFLNLVQQFLDPSNLFFLRFRQFARDVCQRKMDGHEKLSGLVVNSISDALDLLLKRLIELPQSRDGVLNPAVCHFIGR